MAVGSEAEILAYRSTKPGKRTVTVITRALQTDVLRDLEALDAVNPAHIAAFCDYGLPLPSGREDFAAIKNMLR